MVKLSECEEQVMVTVWSSKEAPSSKEVQADVNKRFGNEWKAQTVSTFLYRLVEKGYLRSERKGRGAYYYPKITLQQYREERIRELLDLLYSGDIEAAKSDLERTSNN